MVEVDDGWVELPAVHDPIVQTRFEKKNSSPAESGRTYVVPHSLPVFPYQLASTRFEVLPNTS